MGRGCFIGVEGMLLAHDAVATKEGINGGLLATEALIELLGITAVTLTQYVGLAPHCLSKQDGKTAYVV